jgi:hypothetical protein
VLVEMFGGHRIYVHPAHRVGFESRR